MDLSAIESDIERVIVSEVDLQARIKELAAQVDADYAGRDILLVGVLKGAVMAMADLTRAMQRHLEMDWMAVSSYGSGTKSSGVVRILKDLDRDITGRNVLIVEDIDVKYVGFDIPKDFVVGYGLDFDEKYRNLPFIGVLAKHMYE